METKYKFINNKMTSINFEEKIFDKKNQQVSLSVQVETTIMISSKEDNNYLIQFKFDITDKDNDFKFEAGIINRVDLMADKESSELHEILEKVCLPDLLRRARKMIKDVTTSMNLTPIDLPPFNEEIS